MRKTLFLLFLFSFQSLTAQPFEELINSNPTFTDEVDITDLRENALAIVMPFAHDVILNPEQKKIISEHVIIKIELVYTRYKTVSSFNQKELNRGRLIQLKQLAPHLFEDRLWGFELISQTNGNSREVCDKMFHGFIFTFRPASSVEMLNKEINYLESLRPFLMNRDTTNDDKDTLDNASNYKKTYVKIRTRYDKVVGYVYDTIWQVDTVKPPTFPYFFHNKDSTVIKALARNKEWKNFVIVADVTGSMSPYTAQVFLWLKQQAKNKKAKYFVFFNDGDRKKSNKKEPLKTGGIYITENKGIKSVMSTAAKCMRNGTGGGENMENDIEAILKGIASYPEVDEIILIADNYESMRDYAYIKEINKPVHTILCGSEYRVHIQYLDLARASKGSVHTLKSDINNLQDIKEREHFFIDDKEYMYENGRFHNVYFKPY